MKNWKRAGVGRNARAARPTAISRALERTNAELQAEATIRAMLADGAVVTPIGTRSILRLPGSQSCKEFPTEMVERVARQTMPLGGGFLPPN